MLGLARFLSCGKGRGNRACEIYRDAGEREGEFSGERGVFGAGVVAAWAG
jgi:hypothetical protein